MKTDRHLLVVLSTAFCSKYKWFKILDPFRAGQHCFRLSIYIFHMRKNHMQKLYINTLRGARFGSGDPYTYTPEIRI